MNHQSTRNSGLQKKNTFISNLPQDRTPSAIRKNPTSKVSASKLIDKNKSTKTSGIKDKNSSGGNSRMMAASPLVSSLKKSMNSYDEESKKSSGDNTTHNNDYLVVVQIKSPMTKYESLNLTPTPKAEY